MKLTYREAYDKIIQAYFKDEIEPYDPRFCFCGTLHNGCGWSYTEDNASSYSSEQYSKMEEALIYPIRTSTKGFMDGRKLDPNYEKSLFSGMCAALDVLKEIHRGRGENVDEVPEFKKRELKISFP